MTQAGLRLTELPCPGAGVVVRLGARVREQVLGFGIYPGIRIELVQRFPNFVVLCEETEVSFEEALARQIWVDPVASENDSSGNDLSSEIR